MSDEVCLSSSRTCSTVFRASSYERDNRKVFLAPPPPPPRTKDVVGRCISFIPMFLPIVRAQSRARRQARLPDMHATAAHTSRHSSSSTRLMLGSVAFTLAMSARATSSSAGVGRMAPIVAATPRLSRPRIRGAIPRADFTHYRFPILVRTIRSAPVIGLQKGSPFFGRILKGLYGGLHFILALLLLSA